MVRSLSPIPFCVSLLPQLSLLNPLRQTLLLVSFQNSTQLPAQLNAFWRSVLRTQKASLFFIQLLHNISDSSLLVDILVVSSLLLLQTVLQRITLYRYHSVCIQVCCGYIYTEVALPGPRIPAFILVIAIVKWPFLKDSHLLLCTLPPNVKNKTCTGLRPSLASSSLAASLSSDMDVYFPTKCHFK